MYDKTEGSKTIATAMPGRHSCLLEGASLLLNNDLTADVQAQERQEAIPPLRQQTTPSTANDSIST
jgi:hypothetical protein